MRSLNVLLAEDDQWYSSLIEKILRNAGCEVTVTWTGLQAYERLEQGEQFELLVTDRGMPEMNGEQLIQAVRNDLKVNIPAILQTAGVLDKKRMKHYQAIGFNAIIAKDDLKKVLVPTIEGILGI